MSRFYLDTIERPTGERHYIRDAWRSNVSSLFSDDVNPHEVIAKVQRWDGGYRAFPLRSTQSRYKEDLIVWRPTVREAFDAFVEKL
jgi:hypothetical protein